MYGTLLDHLHVPDETPRKEFVRLERISTTYQKYQKAFKEQEGHAKNFRFHNDPKTSLQVKIIHSVQCILELMDFDLNRLRHHMLDVAKIRPEQGQIKTNDNFGPSPGSHQKFETQHDLDVKEQSDTEKSPKLEPAQED